MWQKLHALSICVRVRFVRLTCKSILDLYEVLFTELLKQTYPFELIWIAVYKDRGLKLRQFNET